MMIGFGQIAWGAVKQFKVTVSVFVALLVFGEISYASLLPREGFPAVDVPLSLGQGTYPSNDIQEVQ